MRGRTRYSLPVTRALALALVLVAACKSSDGERTPDAPPRDAPAVCTASWSQNFTETDTTTTPCASMSGATLALSVPSLRLTGSLPISIDLGVAAPGTYSSASLTDWGATLTVQIVQNICIYQAGATAVPPGTFALDLTDATAPHGTLTLDLAVLAEEFSVCGDPLTEELQLTF